MTQIEAENIIQEVAKRYGFSVDRYSFNGALYIHEHDTHYLNFVILKKNRSIDLEHGRYTYQLVFSASLATMGGNMTPDDLLRASETIRDGAMLVKELNAAELICSEAME